MFIPLRLSLTQAHIPILQARPTLQVVAIIAYSGSLLTPFYDRFLDAGAERPLQFWKCAITAPSLVAAHFYRLNVESLWLTPRWHLVIGELHPARHALPLNFSQSHLHPVMRALSLSVPFPIEDPRFFRRSTITEQASKVVGTIPEFHSERESLLRFQIIAESGIVTLLEKDFGVATNVSSWWRYPVCRRARALCPTLREFNSAEKLLLGLATACFDNTDRSVSCVHPQECSLLIARETTISTQPISPPAQPIP